MILVVSPVSFGVSTFLGDKFSLGLIEVRRAMAQGQLPCEHGNRKDLAVPDCIVVPGSTGIWAGPISWNYYILFELLNHF